MNKCTSIEENPLTTIEIFPNPVGHDLYIDLQCSGTVTMEIRDLSGKMLIAKKIENNTSVDVSALANGIYLVSLSNQDTVQKKVRIVKE